jgi:hypothetical protein
MRALLTFLLLGVLVAGRPVQAAAFGHAGHQIIADIAMQYLSPQAKQKIRSILGSTTPGQAATWMDDVRGNSAYDYMKSWHFINIEPGKAYRPGGKNNIISELERIYKELQQPEKLDKKKRREALMILFHLVGDLHQPLHVGYASDRGGNEIPIRYKGAMIDLHRLWDTELIRDQRITAEDCLKLSTLTPADIARSRFTPADFVAYLNDSRAGLPAVYRFSSGQADEAYIRDGRQIIRLQLLTGGIRLAGVLRQLFG